MESKMATEVLCYQIDDDEVIADALVQAIKEHDSPELVAVRPFHKTQIGGLWARDNLDGRVPILLVAHMESA
jgi:hypothetical protein